MSLELYKDTFDVFLNSLLPDAHVLELGCGPGNVVQYLKTKRPDLNITGIDLSAEMIKVAIKHNPDCNFQVMDILQSDQIQRQFNAIVAAFSLPYISRGDVERFFSNIGSLSTKSALLYISYMEGPEERSGWEQTSFTGNDELYINYYQKQDIEKKVQDQHFEIVASFNKEYFETDGSITTDIIIIGNKMQHFEQR